MCVFLLYGPMSRFFSEFLHIIQYCRVDELLEVKWVMIKSPMLPSHPLTKEICTAKVS